jgi:hypothetical protein
MKRCMKNLVGLMVYEHRLQARFIARASLLGCRIRAGECAMKSVIVKISLAALVAAGASAIASSPAQALPGIDPGVAAGAGPKADKVWCGPYGCGWGAGGSPYIGGYGYGWRPRPWGYGSGWRPRPYYGGGWGPRPYYGGGYGGGGWGW